MTVAEAFTLIDAGEGRWTINRRGTADVAGRVWRTRRGYTLVGVDQRPIDEFTCMEAALGHLLESLTPAGRRRAAARRRGR